MYFVGAVAAIGAGLIFETAWPLAPKWIKIAYMIATVAIVQAIAHLI